jgi:cysteine-rich repeat protein
MKFARNGARAHACVWLLAGSFAALGVACSGDGEGEVGPTEDAGTTGSDAGSGGSDAGSKVNQGPTAKVQDVTTTKAAPVTIALVGSDPDGDALTFATVDAPAHGTLEGFDTAKGTVTYKPAADYLGADSFTFTVKDGATTSAPAKVSIAIVEASLAVAQGQNVTTAEDTAKEITLAATGGVQPVAFAVTTPPTKGTLGAIANGKVTYTPNKDYSGADSFAFSATGVGAAATTANVTLTVTPVNDAPLATAQALTGYVGATMTIKLKATDPDSAAPFTFAVSNALNGTLGAVVNDTVTFTPTAAGAASFTVTANDGQATGPSAKIDIDAKTTATSCQALLTAGVLTSAVYPIDADGAGATYPTRNMQCDQTADGGGWTRVFYHDTTGGFFASKDDAKLKNAADPANKLYSVLQDLDGFKANGGWEFRLDWPLAPTIKNIWTQTSSPLLATATGLIAGYRGVRTDATSHLFGGLELSTSAATLIDGSVTSGDYWFAVGQNQSYGNGIPANDEIGGNATTTQVELWVRAMPKCGNGVKEDLEWCDDGNSVDGDGCSATCAVEKTAYKTCREILAADAQAKSGSYVVDVDGNGGQAPFAVYCDMVNNAGGWTLVGKAGQGTFTTLTDVEYLALVANVTTDVNTGALNEGTIPGTSQMAFFNKAHTDALFNASGKVVRMDMNNNLGNPAANGISYFQKKTTIPVGFSFWKGIRDSRQWNDDGLVTGDSVNNFGTQFVVNVAAGYTPATDALMSGGDGSFGWWSAYTHTLNDASTMSMSRHGGLLCDGYSNQGWLWLLTFDKNDGRFKNENQGSGAAAKSRIWIR